MYYKYVTFCGHRDLPDRAAVEAWLRRTLPCLYAQGARRFYVGGYGAFDAAAAAAALSLRAAHPEVEVVLVRPYLDAGPRRSRAWRASTRPWSACPAGSPSPAATAGWSTRRTSSSPACSAAGAARRRCSATPSAAARPSFLFPPPMQIVR